MLFATHGLTLLTKNNMHNVLSPPLSSHLPPCTVGVQTMRVIELEILEGWVGVRAAKPECIKAGH